MNLKDRIKQHNAIGNYKSRLIAVTIFSGVLIGLICFLLVNKGNQEETIAQLRKDNIRIHKQVEHLRHATNSTVASTNTLANMALLLTKRSEDNLTNKDKHVLDSLNDYSIQRLESAQKDINQYNKLVKK